MSKIEKPAAIVTVALDNRALGAHLQVALKVLDQQVDASLLLQDIISIFGKLNADRLRTSILIDAMSGIESRPWTGMASSDYLDDAQRLARLLRPLHIRPKTIRFNDGTAKGYHRQWFEEALGRAAEPGTVCG